MPIIQPACAVGPCRRVRVEGGLYCSKHGPKQPTRLQPANGDAQMMCPHCEVRGKVRTKQVKRKVGVSGGKATAAVLTAGVSMLATGLSRKQKVTEASCGNCSTTWTIA